MLKNLFCSMAVSADHRSKYAALHRQCLCLHMNEKILSDKKNPKQKRNTKAFFSDSRRKNDLAVYSGHEKHYNSSFSM